MALSKLIKTASNVAAAPVTANAEAVAPTVEAKPSSTTAVALFPEQTGTVTVADALNAALAADTGGAASNGFPIVNLQGGPSGGMFAPAEFLPQEVQDQLPSGKKPINGIFMGYRLAVTGWAVGYSDAPANQGQKPSKPVYSAAASSRDPQALALVVKAAKNYQFTKSANRNKFDYADSKAGHIRVSVEFMVWNPDIGQPMVVTTPSGYGSVEDTLNRVRGLVDPKTGELGFFPCAIRPITEDKSSKGGFSWKQHSLDVANTMNTSEAPKVWEAYQTWVKEAQTDAATVNAVRDWLSATDRKMDATVTAALTAAASL